MAYKVLNDFHEKLDNGRLYKKGEPYPQGDFKPTKNRLEVLSKKHPKYGVKFIEEVKEQKKSKDEE